MLGEVVLDVFERVMQQVTTQRGAGSIDDEPFMHLTSAIGLPLAFPAAKQAHFAVGIPVAMMNPAAHEPDKAGHPRSIESGIITVGEKAPDGLAQFRREFLIAIQRQNPWLGAQAQAQVQAQAQAQAQALRAL